MMNMNPTLKTLLQEAYAPCPAFAGVCEQMRWIPEQGHVPRGFCGATGSLEDVRLVLVCAEPGDPHVSEAYPEHGTPDEQFASSYEYVCNCLRDGKDVFHRNIRLIMDDCFPGLTFDEQLRYVWLTDSVKCSASREGGNIPVATARECCSRYLEREIALFPQAIIVALGRKAAKRLKAAPNILEVAAAAPPYGVRKEAKATWKAISEAVHSRFSVD